MRPLICLTIFCWLFFMPCIAAAVAIGQAQPPAVRIAQLHFNDCLAPCWIGITPGETSAAQVNQKLMQTFNSTNSPLSSSVNRYQWFTIIPLAQPPTQDSAIPIEFSVTSDIIDEIRVPAWFANSAPNDLMPLLGDLVNVLGEPTCVDTSPNFFSGWSFIYEYPAQVLELIVADSDHITWTQPVYFMSIRRNNLEGRVNRCASPSVTLPTWTGLIRRPHYQRLFTALNPQ
jgi:hypothetical protein